MPADPPPPAQPPPSAYGAVGIPTTFVIDGAGQIVYLFLGRVRAPILAATLDRVLASAP